MATQQAPQNLDPAALILAAPEEEFALVELRLDWPPGQEIQPEHKQLWLRCFVITADPLGWIPDRGEAWTAVTVDDEVLEVDLYLTVAAMRAAMADTEGNLAAAVGRYASTVMAAALEREVELLEGDYPRLAARGEAPRVHLDRSNVTLKPVAPVVEECPACQGDRCSATRRAWRTPRSRSASRMRSPRRSSTPSGSRARRSNPTGWRAIDKAVMRITKLPEPTFDPQPPRVVAETPARNDPCPCGSGKKYKQCHGA